MVSESAEQAVEARIEQLTEHLSVIRRNMERVIAENQRMREVVRIAESELRKRRDQVQSLETELAGLQNHRLEARARIENAMEKIDKLVSEQGQDA